MAPTSILELYIWTLSNFHFLLHKDDGVTAVKKTHVVALEKIVSLGQKVLQNQIQGTLIIAAPGIHKLMNEIIDAIRHLILSNFESIPNLVHFLKDVISASMTRVFADATLRASCNELLNIISACPELSKISQTDKDGQHIPDFTLSFLDDFVCQNLEEGGAVFKPLPAKPGSRAALQLAMEIERNHGDAELCASTLAAAACSLGSSELSLAGTENVNNRASSVSSVSSVESRCWAFTR